MVAFSPGECEGRWRELQRLMVGNLPAAMKLQLLHSAHQRSQLQRDQQQREKKKAKKDPSLPKRPTAAYMFFVKVCCYCRSSHTTVATI
jgi:hypothetical protein